MQTLHDWKINGNGFQFIICFLLLCAWSRFTGLFLQWIWTARQVFLPGTLTWREKRETGKELLPPFSLFCSSRPPFNLQTQFSESQLGWKSTIFIRFACRNYLAQKQLSYNQLIAYLFVVQNTQFQEYWTNLIILRFTVISPNFLRLRILIKEG